MKEKCKPCQGVTRIPDMPADQGEYRTRIVPHFQRMDIGGTLQPRAALRSALGYLGADFQS